MSGMKTVGIIGGGQLGMMLAQELHALGARAAVLDPDPAAPAMAVADRTFVAAYDDAAGLEALCRASDAVTYEFENVPGAVLVPLVQRYCIPQGFRPLRDSQDRLCEKLNVQRGGLPTPAFAAANDEPTLREALRRIGYPAVVKTRTLGYDGHGQTVVRTEADIAKALPLLAVPCIVEEFVRFDYEASVILVSDGRRTIHFPVGRNIHRTGILDLSVIPAQAAPVLAERMVAASERFMDACGYRGILAIEFFVRGGEFLFNEMAPRPHNSGHYTIEGCTTNQFRELARYLLELPLEEPKLKSPTVMKNILGEDLDAADRLAAEGHPGVHVHLYGKRETRPKRKMGHVTFTDTTLETYIDRWSGRFVSE